MTVRAVTRLLPPGAEVRGSVRFDGREVTAMTSAEFDLLRAFCERPGRVLSRDSLLDLTQGRNAGSFERSIDVLVSRIRRKIETDPQDSSMIKTVRSGGYLFTPTVEPAAMPVDGAK